MDNSTIALIISGIGLLVVLAKDLFNGGNKLSARFTEMEKALTEQIRLMTSANAAEIVKFKDKHDGEIQRIRTDFLQRNETYEDNNRIGFEAITANIHALQLGFSEFRASMAENYMRRDSYYKATDELKRDMKDENIAVRKEMKDGFDRMERTLGEMAQANELARKSRNSSHA